MADPAAGVRAELASMTVARRHFPMWTEWGVVDESEALHSLGLAYLVALGQELGYAACSDYPVAGPKVRADAVWWDRSTKAVAAIFEFERLKDGTELGGKVRNLMQAWHAARTQPLLGLVYWSPNFFPSGGDAVRELWVDASRGFDDGRRAHVPAIPVDRLLVFECFHNAVRGGGLALKGFSERRRA